MPCLHVCPIPEDAQKLFEKNEKAIDSMIPREYNEYCQQDRPAFHRAGRQSQQNIGGHTMWNFCPYCGKPLEDGCRCIQDAEQYEKEAFEELEWRSSESAWQQDIIDMYRYER